MTDRNEVAWGEAALYSMRSAARFFDTEGANTKTTMQ